MWYFSCYRPPSLLRDAVELGCDRSPSHDSDFTRVLELFTFAAFLGGGARQTVPLVDARAGSYVLFSFRNKKSQSQS